MFESSDLNVMLKVQKTFAQEPGATAVMKKALGLPLPLLPTPPLQVLLVSLLLEAKWVLS